MKTDALLLELSGFWWAGHRENRPKISDMLILKKASRIFCNFRKILEAFFKNEISLILSRFSGLGIEKIAKNQVNFDFEEGLEDFLRFRTVWRGDLRAVIDHS